jgi:hypothetical protein
VAGAPRRPRRRGVIAAGSRAQAHPVSHSPAHPAGSGLEFGLRVSAHEFRP